MGCVPDKVSTFCFKLPYIGHYSGVTQKRIRHLIKRYCINLDIKSIFSSFNIVSLFSAPVREHVFRLAVESLDIFNQKSRRVAIQSFKNY